MEWKKTTDGQANFHGIATKENWLMRIQINGEKSVQDQEKIIDLIAAAPDILKSLKKLIHLHCCEQEGISSGMPTPKEWFESVNDASESIPESLRHFDL